MGLPDITAVTEVCEEKSAITTRNTLGNKAGHGATLCTLNQEEMCENMWGERESVPRLQRQRALDRQYSNTFRTIHRRDVGQE